MVSSQGPLDEPQHTGQSTEHAVKWRTMSWYLASFPPLIVLEHRNSKGIEKQSYSNSRTLLLESKETKKGVRK